MSDIFILQREAGGEPFRFKVGKETFTVKHTRDVNQFALADLFASTTSDVEFFADLFRLAMSGDDLERFKSLEPSRPEINALYDAYKAHCGMRNEGESSASST